MNWIYNNDNNNKLKILINIKIDIISIYLFQHIINKYNSW